MPENIHNQRSGKTNDPQTTTMGKLKTTASGGEIIVGSLRLGFFEIIALINVPDEGCDEAPIYWKWKLAPFSANNVEGRQTRADREEVREDNEE